MTVVTFVQDPQPCHELGCLFYRAGDYPTAKVWLQKAHQQSPRPLTPGMFVMPCLSAKGAAPDEPEHRWSSYCKGSANYIASCVCVAAVRTKHSAAMGSSIMVPHWL